MNEDQSVLGQPPMILWGKVIIGSKDTREVLHLLNVVPYFPTLLGARRVYRLDGGGKDPTCIVGHRSVVVSLLVILRISANPKL